MRKIVTKIVKEFSNPMRFPVAWLELECGHTAKADCDWVNDPREVHDDANHKIKPGDAVDCERCDRYAEKIAKLKAMSPGDISHSRFRHRDSRGFGPGDYYVYGRQPGSPTGVSLLFSIEATEEAGALLSRIAAAPLSPTEPR